MKQITIKDRTYYFGLGFLGNLIANSELTMLNIDSQLLENPFKTMPTIMYHSLAYGYLKQGLSPDFDIYDICEWLDEDETLGVQFMEAFRNSMVKDVPVVVEDEAKKKKKSTGVVM